MTRSGGFAGISRHTSLESADLAEEESTRLHEAMLALDARPPAPPGTATSRVDRFQYDLVVTSDDGTQHLSLAEADLPTGFRQLLDDLLSRPS